MNTPLAAIGATAVLALAATASGCSESSQAQSGMALSGSKYCAPFKANGAASLSAALNDPAASFDDCVHRWAYTLAPDRDPADVVARAAVDACGPILGAWNRQSLGQDQESAEPGGRGQPANNPLAQRMGMVESRALFYVVQARAAGCQPPPASTLLTVSAPTGGG